MTAAERQAWASGRLRVLLLSEDEDPGWASSILGEALAGHARALELDLVFGFKLFIYSGAGVENRIEPITLR